MKFIQVYTQIPHQPYLPLRQFAFVRLEAGIALVCAGVVSGAIVPLVAFIAPVLLVEQDVGLGDDEEVAGLVIFVVVVVVKVQDLRINKL